MLLLLLLLLPLPSMRDESTAGLEVVVCFFVVYGGLCTLKNQYGIKWGPINRSTDRSYIDVPSSGRGMAAASVSSCLV